MLKRYFGILAITGLLLSACDSMEEHERLIYEKPEPAKRVVLLEDFTGQRCTNCPRATDVIAQLQELYGEDALVAVSIHGGPLGFAGNATMPGLATDAGDDYYRHWNLEYQPIGLVDRHAPVNYPEWAAAVKDELSKPAPLRLFGRAELYGDDIHISISAMGTDGLTTGKLQVWLIEDNITALQLMPDGTADYDYVHRHVLRTPVNGTWGTAITLQEGESADNEYHLVMDDSWNPDELSIVAFVYNDNGVCQTTLFDVINSQVPAR